jgi:transcriptional regulator with XRE-family HTH domain
VLQGASAATARRPVRRSSLLEHGEPALFGEIVRSARLHQGLSLEEVAGRAGTSASHLSRLERGKRMALSRDLLDRIAATLDVDPVRLFAAVGLLPPAIERELADDDFSFALVDGARLPYRTRWALRRRHLAGLAEREFPAPGAGPVDLVALLTQRGYAAVEEPGGERRIEIAAATVQCGGDPPPQRRFLLAHGLAHIVLESTPRCHLYYPARDEGEHEAEATALASFILVPTSPLAIAVREEAERFDVWVGGTGPLIEAVAGRFGAPAWLTARRIAEEGFFADAAELEDV